MELETMELITQMRDKLRSREDVLATAIETMNKENANSPYLKLFNSFPALAVLENVAPHWIEPMARSLENNIALTLDAPLEIRSIHSALSLWKPSNRDQLVTIIIYGFLVENGKICHSPDDFKTTLMICTN